MKKTLLLVFLITFYSCNQNVNSQQGLKKNERVDLISQLKCISNEIHNNAFSNISLINKKQDKLEIEYIFNTSEIVHHIHQKLFLTYLLYNSSYLREYKEITFKYFVNEEKYNAKTFLIDEKIKAEILKNLDFEPLNKMLYLCLKDFHSDTIFDLNIWIENVRKVYPDETLNTDFFLLVEKLSFDCFTESENKEAKEAKVTLVLMYVAIKDAIENGTFTKAMRDSQRHNLMIIEKIWNICENGEKIEFAEQRLFGRVGNNWVPK